MDVCCLNRPFDDQGQHRIRLEAAAVVVVLSLAESGKVEWIGSEGIDLEVDMNPDVERRRWLAALAGQVRTTVRVEDRQQVRARELERSGFGAYDALHLACAETARADVSLTTDDRLLRRAARPGVSVGVEVRNPLRWVEEVLGLWLTTG